MTALADVSSELLPELTRATHSALVFLYDAGPRGISVHGPAGAAALVDEYFRDYVSTCPLHELKGRVDGAIIPTTRLAASHGYARSAVYSDFFGPHGLDHHLAVRLLPSDGEGGEIGVMFNRGRGQGEFSDDEIAQVRALVPSLAVALRLARQLDRTRGRNDDLEALLLALDDDVPKLLVDADGRVAHVQEAAGSELGPVVELLRDPRHPVIVAARMLVTDVDSDVPPTLVHRIRSPLGHCFRAELALAIGQFRGRPLVIVRLVREGASEVRAEWSSWRLSRAEASVLAELVAGGTNVEIGNRLFISPETVRTHLTRIFKKLGVRTRLEAVVLALRARRQNAGTR